MRDKLLLLFGTVAIFAAGFAKPSRLKRAIDMTLTDAQKETLLNKFKQSPVLLLPDDIPKLMYMKRDGELTDVMKTKLAEAILSPDTVIAIKAQIKVKLNAGTALTPPEQPVAWAMSVTNGELTDAEKATYEKQRFDSQSKLDMPDLSATDLAALVTKMTNAEALTIDEVIQLISEVDELQPVNVAKLAEYVLKDVTSEQKTAILAKVAAQEKMTKEERNILWAMSEKNELPEGTRPTRAELEEEAGNLVKDLTSEQKAALKAKLADDTTIITEDDLMKLKAIETLGDLTQTQRDKLDLRIAETIDEETMERLQEAIGRMQFTEDDIEKIKALVKSGKLEADVLKMLEEKAGIMPNGERITDAFTENAEIPDALGLTETQKELVREMGRNFGGQMEFENIKNKEMMKEVLEKYERMTEARKDMLANLTLLAGSLRPSDIEEIDPELLEMIPASTLSEVADELGAPQKKALCRVGMQGDPELYKKMAAKCDELLTDISADMEESERRSLADNLIDLENPSKIEGDLLNDLINANALFEEALDRVDAGEFLTNVDLIRVARENGQSEVIMKKVKAAKGGSLSGITADEIKKLGSVPLDEDDIDEIPAAVIKEAAKDILGAIPEDDLKRKAQISKKIRETLPANIPEASADDLFTLLEAGGMTDSELEAVSESKIEEMLTKSKQNKLTDPKEKRSFTKRVMSLSKYSDAASMTETEVEEIAEFLGDVPDQFFEGMPDSAKIGAIASGTMKDVTNLGKKKARELGHLAVQNIDKSSATDVVNKLSSEMMSAMDATDLETFPDATLANSDVLGLVLQAIDDMESPNIQVVVKKLKAKIRSEVPVCSLGKICESLPISDVESWDDAVINEIKTAGSSCKLECGLGQLAVLAKKMVNLLGEPGADNENYDTEAWNALYILIPGLSVDLINKIPADNKIPALVRKVLRELEDKMADNKLEALIAILEKTFATKKPGTKEEIAAFGPAFRDYDKASLTRDVPAALCSTAVKELKDLSKTTIPETRLRDQAKYALECLTGQASGAINSEAAAALGDLICYMPPERVTDLTDQAARDMSNTIQNCPLKDATARKPYKDKMMTAAGLTGSLSSLTEEGMGIIMFFLGDLSKTQVDEIPNVVKSEALDYAVTNQVTREKELADREGTLGENIGMEAVKDEGVKTVRPMISARISVSAAAAGGATRRKRSTGSIQCSDIKSAGQMAKAFTISELSSLTDAVILECMTTLGGVLEWSSEQKSNLAARLKTSAIHGTDLSQWTNAKIEDSGTMLEGLSTSDLGLIPWTTNTLGVHGSRSTWTSTQLTAAASKWLQSVKSNNAATITSDDLNVIGHFICGLTETQINSIPNTVYEGAVVKVGEAQGCSGAKAKAFSTKAKALFGAVNTWTVSHVINVNNVLAGLTGTELSSLPATHLVELRPETIAILPVDTISGLTSTQIRGLSKAQALGVTKEQFDAFNPSQQEALRAAGGYKYTSDKSAAGINKMPIISGMVVVMVTLFLM